MYSKSTVDYYTTHSTHIRYFYLIFFFLLCVRRHCCSCSIWSISEGVSVEITGMWQLFDIKVNRRHVAICPNIIPEHQHHHPYSTPTHLIDNVEREKNNNKYSFNWNSSTHYTEQRAHRIRETWYVPVPACTAHYKSLITPIRFYYYYY